MDAKMDDKHLSDSKVESTSDAKTDAKTDSKDSDFKDSKDDTSSRILAAAAERDRLAQLVAATQHAKPTLGQLAPQIADLTNKGYDASQLLSTLRASLREQRAALDKHQKQAESAVSKLFHRHTTDPKALEAEEDAYFEAWDWANKAHVKLDRIDDDLGALKTRRADLRALHDQHTAALIALDELYASVFDGPSPGLSEEDALEAAVQAAQAVYDAIQARLTHALAVAGHLNAARGKVTAALSHIATALKFSRQDIVDSNGVHHGSAASAANLLTSGQPVFSSARADRRERAELARVPALLAEAEHNLALAKQMDPQNLSKLTFLPAVSVAGEGHSVANILDQVVNTPLTDYLFHMEIKDTEEGVRACLAVLDPEADNAEARADAIRQERTPAEAALNDGRRQLMDLRVELFEKALRARDGQKEVEPPAYEGTASVDEKKTGDEKGTDVKGDEK